MPPYWWSSLIQAYRSIEDEDLIPIYNEQKLEGCNRIMSIILDVKKFRAMKRKHSKHYKKLKRHHYWFTNYTSTKSYTIRMDYNTKLAGATVFPVDTDRIRNSEHHPWACSLRTRGFRGRHRCGVTLLSGKQPKNTI